MFNVSEVGFQGSKSKIATFPTFEAAKTYVEGLGVVYMEDDTDYPGCADAFLKDQRLIVIEPENKA